MSSLSSSSSSKLFTVLHWRKFFSSDELLTAHRCSVDELSVNYDDEQMKTVRSMSGKVTSDGAVYETSIDRFPNMRNMNFGVSDYHCSCQQSQCSSSFCPHAAALLLKYERLNGVITISENEEQYSERLKQQQVQRVLDKISKDRGVTFDIRPISEFSIFSHHQGQLCEDYIDFISLLKRFVSLPATENRAREILFSKTMELENTEYTVDDNFRICLSTDVTYSDLFDKKHSFRMLLNSEMVIWQDLSLKELDPQDIVQVEVPYPKFKWPDKKFLNEYQIAALELAWQWYCVNSYSRVKSSFMGELFVDKMQSAIENGRYDRYLKSNDLNFLLQDKTEKKKSAVLLIPRITFDCHGEKGFPQVNLSFSVQDENGKKYFLDSPFELVFSHENGGRFILPRNRQIDFSCSEFDERSLKYLGIIKRIVSTASDFFDYVRKVISEKKYPGMEDDYYEDPVNFFDELRDYYGYAAYIPLKGEFLDIFYNIAENSTVDFCLSSSEKAKNESVSGFMVGGSEDLVLNFELSCTAKKTGGKTVSEVKFSGSMPVILKGEGSRCYIATKNRMLKKNEEELVILENLSKSVTGFGDFSLTFDESRFYEFFYNIYPAISSDPLFHIDTSLTPEEIEKLAGISGEYIFYLDVLDKTREKVTVSLKCEIVYGDSRYVLGDDPDEKQVIRNRAFEQRVIKVIEEQCCGQRLENPQWIWNLDLNTELKDFLTDKLEHFHVFGQVNGSAEFNRLRTRRSVRLDFDIVKSSNLLDLRLTGDVDVDELYDLLQSYADNKKWYRLSSGEYVSLYDDPSIEQAYSLLKKLNIMPADAIFQSAKIPLFRSLYLEQLIQERNEIVFSKDKSLDELITRLSEVKNSEYRVPDNLGEIMREYQIYGFKWLKIMLHSGFGAVLADDMGLGKTLQMISVIWSEIEERRNSDPDNTEHFLSLVVSPSSLVYQWCQEFNRFAPAVRVCPMVGNSAARKVLRDRISEVDVYVMSYELLVKDVPFLREINFDLVVLDEAQKIKNYKSLTAKSVKLLNSQYKVAMTGTPIENRLAELWSIFDFIMPSYLYSFEDFSHNFEFPIAMLEDKSVVATLKAMVSPFILRRRKIDVLKELPDKIEDVVYAVIDGEQQKLYDAQVLKLKNIISNSDRKNLDTFVVLSELLRMRQLCCHPSLVYPGYSKNSAKTDICIELVESAMEAGHRMLIFSQFTSMLSIIEQELDRRQIPYYSITGSTPKEKRVALVEQFNNDTTPVFLISLKAGGTGLNLTGADTVIHYDPWWNLAAQNQATDRAHRMGQTRTVTVYRLIMKGTIEEKIMKLQEGKKDLADSILEGEQKSLMNMSREELLSILS
jgi:superfamily II DNA or RNA helicase